SMKDVAIELSEIVDEYEELSVSATSASGSASGDALRAPASSRRTPVATVSAIALVVIAIGFYAWRRAVTRTTPAPSFNSMKVARLTSSGNVNDAAISPEGKYVAHVHRDAAGQWILSVRQIATGSDVTVIPPSPTPIQLPRFSRDGNYVFYTRNEQE